ncbi:MAG: hypothetical protein LLG13_12250 [Bacteroidales bacterium]|nr:hypothetical protein [Bacteroidales bacterium]
MNNINILIIEDEQRLADILKKQLDESGFNAEIAYDEYVGNDIYELFKRTFNSAVTDF